MVNDLQIVIPTIDKASINMGISREGPIAQLVRAHA